MSGTDKVVCQARSSGILKQEKHMGDALLQKTYTADFLTKRQVKNNGEVAQVYVKDSHKGIIDKETWNAVQEEFERREKFTQKHGTDRYSYGSECYPFCEKIVLWGMWKPFYKTFLEIKRNHTMAVQESP